MKDIEIKKEFNDTLNAIAIEIREEIDLEFYTKQEQKYIKTAITLLQKAASA